MPEQLDASDFRSARWKMLPDDFAVWREDVQHPKDVIDEKTWKHLVLLPDDVSIQTSSMYGHHLREMVELCSAWQNFTFDALSLEEGTSSPLGWAVLNSLPELEASIFNALVGYYEPVYPPRGTCLSILP